MPAAMPATLRRLVGYYAIPLRHAIYAIIDYLRHLPATPIVFTLAAAYVYADISFEINFHHYYAIILAVSLRHYDTPCLFSHAAAAADTSAADAAAAASCRRLMPLMPSCSPPPPLPLPLLIRCAATPHVVCMMLLYS